MIIFIGAGASETFGIPTTKGFIELFERESAEKELYYLCNDIKTGIGEELFDLESLMSILDDLKKPEADLLRDISPYTSRFLIQKLRESGMIYYENAGINEEADKLLHLLKKIIRRECFTAVRDRDRKSLIVETYEAFFDNANKLVSSRSHIAMGRNRKPYPPRTSIFTTNYDNCAETYLDDQGVDFNNGIERRGAYYSLNVAAYGAYKGSNVEIVKLHGSIDLFKKGEEIRQFQGFTPDYEAPITHLGDDPGEEFMVWPIESSGARHITQSPHLDLYNLFRNRILQELDSNEPVILIIGFSFRDLTITSIMNEVLRLQSKAGRPNVIFIDPKAMPTIARIKNDGFFTLADLITPIEGKFRVGGVFERLATLKK